MLRSHRLITLKLTAAWATAYAAWHGLRLAFHAYVFWGR